MVSESVMLDHGSGDRPQGLPTVCPLPACPRYGQFEQCESLLRICQAIFQSVFGLSAHSIPVDWFISCTFFSGTWNNDIFEVGRIPWIFSSHIVDIPSTACPSYNLHYSTSALRLPEPRAGRQDLTPIAARWNIVMQNESNRKRNAYHECADCADGATQRSLRRQRNKAELFLDPRPGRPEHVMDVMESGACNWCNRFREHVMDSRACNGCNRCSSMYWIM